MGRGQGGAGRNRTSGDSGPMSVGDFLDNKISDAKNKGQSARYSPSTIERVRGYVESGVIPDSLWEGMIGWMLLLQAIYWKNIGRLVR